MNDFLTSLLTKLAEQGPVIAILVALLLGLFVGRLRFEREIVEKDKAIAEKDNIIERQGAVVAENTQMTSDAIKVLGEAVLAMKEAIRELDGFRGDGRRR